MDVLASWRTAAGTYIVSILTYNTGMYISNMTICMIGITIEIICLLYMIYKMLYTCIYMDIILDYYFPNSDIVQPVIPIRNILYMERAPLPPPCLSSRVTNSPL